MRISDKMKGILVSQIYRFASRMGIILEGNRGIDWLIVEKKEKIKE